MFLPVGQKTDSVDKTFIKAHLKQIQCLFIPFKELYDVSASELDVFWVSNSVLPKSWPWSSSRMQTVHFSTLWNLYLSTHRSPSLRTPGLFLLYMQRPTTSIFFQLCGESNCRRLNYDDARNQQVEYSADIRRWMEEEICIKLGKNWCRQCYWTG